jgi:hypothetical protein
MDKRASGFSGLCASTRNALHFDRNDSWEWIFPTYVSIALLSRAAIGTYKHGSNPAIQGIRAACESIGRKFIA